MRVHKLYVFFLEHTFFYSLHGVSDDASDVEECIQALRQKMAAELTRVNE